jgi:hypothetical protein
MRRPPRPPANDSSASAGNSVRGACPSISVGSCSDYVHVSASNCSYTNKSTSKSYCYQQNSHFRPSKVIFFSLLQAQFRRFGAVQEGTLSLIEPAHPDSERSQPVFIYRRSSPRPALPRADVCAHTGMKLKRYIAFRQKACIPPLVDGCSCGVGNHASAHVYEPRLLAFRKHFSESRS